MNEKIKALDMKNAFSPPQVHLISEFNEPGIPNSLNFKKSDKFINFYYENNCNKDLKSGNNFENSNSTSFDNNKKNYTTEVDHLISSDSETKKSNFFI